jgi:hypothetical protein
VGQGAQGCFGSRGALVCVTPRPMRVGPARTSEATPAAPELQGGLRLARGSTYTRAVCSASVSVSLRADRAEAYARTHAGSGSTVRVDPRVVQPHAQQIVRPGQPSAPHAVGSGGASSTTRPARRSWEWVRNLAPCDGAAGSCARATAARCAWLALPRGEACRERAQRGRGVLTGRRALSARGWPVPVPVVVRVAAPRAASHTHGGLAAGDRPVR